MKNEIFVCKARVVFGQDVVFFRVFPYFVEKHEKQEGVGGGRGREKRCTFFLTSAVCKVNFGKKSTFFTIPGIPWGGSGHIWLLCSILRISLFCGREATA